MATTFRSSRPNEEGSTGGSHGLDAEAGDRHALPSGHRPAHRPAPVRGDRGLYCLPSGRECMWNAVCAQPPRCAGQDDVRPQPWGCGSRRQGNAIAGGAGTTPKAVQLQEAGGRMQSHGVWGRSPQVKSVAASEAKPSASGAGMPEGIRGCGGITAK